MKSRSLLNSFYVLVFCISAVMLSSSRSSSKQDWSFSTDKKLVYRYTSFDSTLYIIPLYDSLFISGLLFVNNNWIEYIKMYDDLGFDCHSTPGGDWDIGYLSFNTSVPAEFSDRISIDSIYYRRLPGIYKDSVALEAFSIWNEDISVGGLNVGDCIDSICMKFRIKDNYNVRKIHIGNYYEIYYRNQEKDGIIGYFEGFESNFLPYNEETANTWENLPDCGVTLILENGKVFNIKTPNIVNGRFFSPSIY